MHQANVLGWFSVGNSKYGIHQHTALSCCYYLTDFIATVADVVAVAVAVADVVVMRFVCAAQTTFRSHRRSFLFVSFFRIKIAKVFWQKIESGARKVYIAYT